MSPSTHHASADAWALGRFVQVLEDRLGDAQPARVGSADQEYLSIRIHIQRDGRDVCLLAPEIIFEQWMASVFEFEVETSRWR